MTDFHQSNMCHAKTNELVGRLAEREERDRTYFGRLRHEREKKLRDPQDVLIEADRLGQYKKRQARRSPRASHLTSPVRLIWTKPAAGIWALCG
jgi:hypothetical protein